MIEMARTIDIIMYWFVTSVEVGMMEHASIQVMCDFFAFRWESLSIVELYSISKGYKSSPVHEIWLFLVLIWERNGQAISWRFYYSGVGDWLSLMLERPYKRLWFISCLYYKEVMYITVLWMKFASFLGVLLFVEVCMMDNIFFLSGFFV